MERADTKFEPGDFRNNYFAGDRLQRSVARAEKVRDMLAGSGYDMVQAALKFVLAHPAVSTVIPGMRNAAQAAGNCAVSDLPSCRRLCWKSSKSTIGGGHSGMAANRGSKP